MEHDEGRPDETAARDSEAYEPPALIATHSIDELRADAATCLADFSGPS
jgi:hypothetical protein